MRRLLLRVAIHDGMTQLGLEIPLHVNEAVATREPLLVHHLDQGIAREGQRQVAHGHRGPGAWRRWSWHPRNARRRGLLWGAGGLQLGDQRGPESRHECRGLAAEVLLARKRHERRSLARERRAPAARRRRPGERRGGRLLLCLGGPAALGEREAELQVRGAAHRRGTAGSVPLVCVVGQVGPTLVARRAALATGVRGIRVDAGGRAETAHGGPRARAAEASRGVGAGVLLRADEFHEGVLDHPPGLRHLRHR
mmetsp:Transcript_65789/g.177722  ORF Transcript_65789/g.177722 Transcript_65789/m.177722 type:complete len:253 (-) Transcript_65789:100-858(-)